MSDTSVKAEIGIGLVKLSVTAPIRSLTRFMTASKAAQGPALVAKRFLQVFADHGVQITQIPHFLPQIGLDALSSTAKLLPALTSPILDRTAELFGVQREWLDGVSENIYRCRHCYKTPQRFFDDLSEFFDADAWFCVRALTTTMDLDRKGGTGQDLVIVMQKTLKRTHDEEIYSYAVYGDVWDWSYAPSRIQLKAMARLTYLATECPVPLFKVPRKTIESVRMGLAIPRSLVEGCLMTHPSLEDYVLSLDESGQARETEELDTVLKYIERNSLEEHVKKLFTSRQIRKTTGKSVITWQGMESNS